jgi:citrate synthase
MDKEHSGKRTRPSTTDESGKWKTAITRIEPNKVLVRGYPLDEMMGRVSFGDAIYLLLSGELPSPSVSRLVSAILVSSVDHGAMPPSTVVARNVATTGAPLRAAVAAGVLSFGSYHGGDVEGCMEMLDAGLALVRAGQSYQEAAEAVVQRKLDAGERVPGLGHRLHTHDPRANKLLQMAYELDLEGEHIRLMRMIDRALAAALGPSSEGIHVNVDGAIAGICGDLGLDREFGNALFIISRVPGLIAHAHEERLRERPMRRIDPSSHVYDGPGERRLPDYRK